MGTKMEDEAKKQEKELADSRLLAQVTESFSRVGKDYVQIRDDLNSLGIKTAKGKEWTRENVQKYVARHIVKKESAPTELVTITNAVAETTNEDVTTRQGEVANGLVVNTKEGNVTKAGKTTNDGKATKKDSDSGELVELTNNQPAITNEDEPVNDRVTDLVTATNVPNATDSGKPFADVPNNTNVTAIASVTNLTNTSETPMDALIRLYESGTIPQLIAWWESHVSQDRELPAMEEQRPVIRGNKIRNGKSKANTGIQIDIEVLERAQAKLKQEAVATGGSLSQLVELLLWRYIGAPQDLVHDD
jgi:hypothetical protein